MDFLWVIIVFAIVISLPDLLRRKRRYPTRRNTKPGPMGDNIPTSRKSKPIDLEKEQPPVFTKTQQEKLPEQSIPVPQELPVQIIPETVSAAVNMISQPVSPTPWSQLPPQAQQIYAGFIWSEILWAPPLSKRRR